MTKTLAALLVALPVVAAAQPAGPAPAKAALLYERGLVTGAVPGLPGYKLTVTTSADHCGGKKVVVTRPKKKLTTDVQLAAVFDLDSPTGLNFDPDPTKKSQREKSLQKFNAFVEKMTTTGVAAMTHYTAQLSTKDPEATFAAAARILQVQLQTARLLAYAEIPKDVRTGEFKDEKIATFCDKMTEVVEPIDARAKDAFDRCQPGATQFASAWWAPLCTAP